ncbi:glycoside hydrolase family 88 protein [Aquibacillus albus]|uniref:Rhamnogalacturonyl hydrolase YesR n=1 Tax=Aquibacillus albus TaxID=1168171 RepID=A0ABS2MVZ8_9BACI|nr:glycoside hydrolase family 88 protein [Aquibacillus albus]MBM7569973.1 rhamnogalacturonyl hydrolase YesR [Aquibacillus albus]
MVNQQKVDKVKKALLGMQRFSWEQGVAAQALLELGDTDNVILLAKDSVVRQDKSGRLGVMGDTQSVTDPAANGEPLLFAAIKTGDSKLQEAVQKMLHYLLNDAPKSESGILYHVNHKKQVWVDSFYMAPPFLAVMGHEKEAVKQIEGFRDLLWSEENQLFSHMWDDDINDFARKDFWGVGNGWAAAGIVRVIEALPESMSDDKKRLMGYVKEIIDGCLRYQREDGLFHDVLDDPSTFVETNVGQMLSYSIYRGVSSNWLSSSYLEQANKMREAAHKKVDEFGIVQGVCSAPHFDKSGSAPEGQAFFLLMEAVANKVVPV